MFPIRIELGVVFPTICLSQTVFAGKEFLIDACSYINNFKYVKKSQCQKFENHCYRSSLYHFFLFNYAENSIVIFRGPIWDLLISFFLGCERKQDSVCLLSRQGERQS